MYIGFLGFLNLLLFFSMVVLSDMLSVPITQVLSPICPAFSTSANIGSQFILTFGDIGDVLPRKEKPRMICNGNKIDNEI